MNFKKRVNGSWVDTPNYIHNTSTDTIATLPAEIYPNDTTATVGLKGQAVQSGTPTPENPIMPQSCGERTGNLFDADSYYADYKSGDSYIATTSQYNNITISPFTTSDIGKTYTISCNITDISSTNVRWIAKINDVSVNGDGRSNTGQIKLTFTVETENDSFRITYGSGNYTLTITNVMMNEGSTALPYEPYGYKIPILSNSITTQLYLGEVETTRRIKKYEFTGNEQWNVTTGKFYLQEISPDYLRLADTSTYFCSHFPVYPQTNRAANVPDNMVAFGSSTVTQRVYCTYTGVSTTADFKAYLAQQYAAGTPVCVWYVLETEETAVVNEPLMKIGDYADEVANVSIPITAGGDTLSVGTTVQPSEVTVNYKGWHPVADVHEYDSNYTIATMQALTIAQLQTHTISDLQGGGWS